MTRAAVALAASALALLAPGVAAAQVSNATAVGDAPSPAAAERCPGGTPALVDAFTLSATGVADKATSVTVTLSPRGAWFRVGAVAVTDATGAVTYGSAGPGSDVVAVPISGGLPAPLGTPVVYAIAITPREHAGMPAPESGAIVPVSARVTAISTANATKTYADAASAVVSIDDLPPANPAWDTIAVSSGAIALTWTAPEEQASLLVLRRAGAAPASVPQDGATYEVNASLGGGSVIAAGATTSAPQTGLVDGSAYHYLAYARDACGNWSTGAPLGPIVPPGSAEGDPTPGSTKPVVDIVSPARGGAVSGTFRVQVRVFSPTAAGAAQPIGAVALNTDGGTATFPIALARSANYGTDPASGVFEAQLTLSPGAYTLRARAANGSGAVLSRAISVRVNAAGAGDGNLLRRESSSQLCTDCHAIKPHSSETAGAKYGSWSTACLDCHTPHGTRNAFLVKDVIDPPATGGYAAPKRVFFSNRSGYSNAPGAATPGDATYANADRTGPCQVCHTRTVSPSGAPRFRGDADSDAHHTARTEDCATCHGHETGFKGKTCQSCHLGIGDDDSFAYGDEKAARIDSTEWTTFGHGRAGAYLSANAGAAFSGGGLELDDQGCAYCHSSGTSHDDPANRFRLANAELGRNGACLVCHDRTGDGYDPDGAGAAYPKRDGKNVTVDHTGARHVAPDHNGGLFCWDCHDPHGDAAASGNPLWYMMQRAPVENSDATGLPQAFAAPIEFRQDLGAALDAIDYPDYVAGGLCRNCHDTWNAAAMTGAAHYSKTTSDGHGSTLGFSLKNRCTDCHVHAGGCDSCHQPAKPTSGAHLAHNGLTLTTPTSYVDVVPESTADAYGYKCTKCHAGSHANDSHAGTSGDPYQVEVAFDASTAPASAGGAYASGAAQPPSIGTDGKSYGWTSGTCSNVYCHSRANPVGGVDAFASVTWRSGSLACDSCHDTAGTATTLSPGHRLHVNDYAQDCALCHASSASGTAVLDRRLHANGSKDLAFEGANAGTTWDAAQRTCAGTYCHSDGTRTSAPFTPAASIAWTALADCRSCHPAAAAAGPAIATGAHGPHVAGADLIGVNFGCAECHATVVSSDTAVKSPSLHVNGIADVAFPTGGAWANGTCGGTYCHSSGQPSSVRESYDVLWRGETLECAGCHGRHSNPAFPAVAGEPNYPSGPAGAVDANSHHEHVTSAAQCIDCHDDEVSADGNAIVQGSNLHLDGARDVRIATRYDANGGTKADNYDAVTKTCSNVSCHGAKPVRWGATLGCTGCHDMTGDGTTLSPQHAVHVNAYAYDCVRCHASSATSTQIVDPTQHGDGEKDVAFDASAGMDNSGALWEAQAQTCAATYCHSDGTDRTAPYPVTTSLAWTTNGSCRSCHGGGGTVEPVIRTAAHDEHVAGAAVNGVNFGCAECHASVVSSDTTVEAPALHVNVAADVAFPDGGSWNGASCSGTYCHSSGQPAASRQSFSIGWTGPTIGCDGCHGRDPAPAFTPIAGEPNYANGGSGSTTANSHRAHLATASQCRDCHDGIVTAEGGGLEAGTTLHLDRKRDVLVLATWDTNGATSNYDAATQTCSAVSCHGTGTARWGATLGCADCHGGTTDRDSWAIADGTLSTVSMTEWAQSGHGSAAAGFPGADPCLYCHDRSVPHGNASNPFRLANNGATGDGWSSNCLVCHKKTGVPGYDPGSGLKTATVKNDANHYGADHAATRDGGQRCWDCHDVHGDASNLKMIGRDVLVDAADEHGLTGTRATNVAFTARASGADYATATTPSTGICAVCHSQTSFYTAAGGPNGHPTTACISCHPHNQPPVDAFKGSGGGDCLACHGTTAQGTTPVRRPVTADFSKQSHHVGTGGTMGGTLTNFDCVVCHGEGALNGADAATTALHGNKLIDLRNADDLAATLAYDKRGMPAPAASWNSSDATWRQQTSTALDPFCLSCHDANGASATYQLGDNKGVTGGNQNPFKDTAITNNYDEKTRPSITDIKSKVSGAPPPQGQFARHAIRGQSTSIYTTYTGLTGTSPDGMAYQTMYDYGGFTNMGTDESGRPVWNDTSVLGCADCHTSDGANGAAGNGHGSASEYLLKDASGAASEGTKDGMSYVCWRCHTYALYDGKPHVGSDSDYTDYTAQVGAARIPNSSSGGNWTGTACGNCHGTWGKVGTAAGTVEFGGIHGTSSTGTTVSATGAAKNNYRFINAASLRFYDPQGWNTGSATCYTLSSGDSWGGCTKHSGRGTPRTKALVRPLNY